MLFVTEPFLPPIDRYREYLEGIWQRNHLTNNGPLVQELEKRVPEYLGSCHMAFLSNGTIALQIALKALGISKEVITTPFSYVATTSSVVWEGCTPRFADIDPDTWNISVDSIESLINENTEAILATHVFGNPCDVHAIQDLADRYGLKVIYDAAHAFGSKVDGKSIFDYGDISTASFHATKLFHTTEGGAIFTKDEEIIRRVSLMRNFGHNGPENFDGLGVNGKNSEFHAAMGLCNLEYIDAVLEKRRSDYMSYRQEMQSSGLGMQVVMEDHSINHSYFPVLFSSENELKDNMEMFKQQEIFPRRYFYPSLDRLEYVDSAVCPNTHDISTRILCLPLSYQLTKSDQQQVIDVLMKVEA